MKTKLISLTLILWIVFFGGIPPVLAAEKQVSLAYTDWSSSIASSHLVKVMLEEMGYKVTLLSVDSNMLWQTVADGHADAMVSAWLPMTHQQYLEETKDQIENLGPNLAGAQVGLVVPTYVTVDSIEALNANVDKFNGRIFGIEAGAGITHLTKEAISAYELAEFQLVEANENMMVNALEAAIKNKQWIVVTGWTPHWKFSRWELKYLEDPKGLYGGEERIHTIVRQGLQQEMPDVYKALDNFAWTVTEIEKLILLNQEVEAIPYQNAKNWVQENQDQVMKWMDKILIVQAASYDLDTGQLHLPVVELFSDGKRVGAIKGDMQLHPDSLETAQPLFELKQVQSLNRIPIGYGSMLKRIDERGQLICGISASVNQPGFAYLDENGRYEGFDVALCRAVAIAVLNNPEAVEFILVDSAEREDHLRAGKVDILSRQTTWTTHRDARWGEFTWIMFYDGQGFMVRKDSGITSLEELEGATICVDRGTTSEQNLSNVFRERGLTFTPVVSTNSIDNYQANQCTAITGDKSKLAIARFNSTDPEAHFMLDITVSKEPLAPVVPHGDNQWADLVRTVMVGLINAEELGITQSNLDLMKRSLNPSVKRLLGVEDSFGQGELGLKPEAIANVIRALGNYGEIYDRYMGANGIGIPRDLNRLWNQGGLIYALP